MKAGHVFKHYGRERERERLSKESINISLFEVINIINILYIIIRNKVAPGGKIFICSYFFIKNIRA